MIKAFGYLTRKPGLSLQEFADYYERNHVPLVLSKAAMPVVYKRNYIQRRDPFNLEGDDIGFDCMTELVFADRDGFLAWVTNLAATRSPVTKRSSSIGQQLEPTWWTSGPARAERGR